MREDRTLAPHQNDAGLAKNSQTIYAERESNMAEPTTTQERPSEVNGQSSNGAARGAERTVRKVISQVKETDEKAHEAVRRFAKEVVDREGAPRTIEPQAQAAAVPVGVKDYFPNVPAGLGGAVNEFYQELRGLREGSSSRDIPTEFFIKHYLRLRQLAEEKGQDIAFLAEIRKELIDRKIDVDSLWSQAKTAIAVERHWRGELKAGKVSKEDAEYAVRRGVLPARGGATGLDLRGITDAKLREKGEEINDQIAALGGQYNDNDLRSRWSEISALNGEVAHDQKRLLLNEINRAMLQAREERQKEEEKYRYTKPGTGISGERILSPDDLKRIEADIDKLVDEAVRTGRLPDGRELKGTGEESIDWYFNRIFNRVDSLRGEEFDKAMGHGANREHEDITRELSVMKGDASERYSQATDETTRTREAYKRDIIQRFLDRFSEEISMRRILHNAFYIAETEGEFKNFAEYCKSFASKYADQAFLDKPEVEVALRIREYVLYEIKRENKGLIPPELVSYSPDRAESVWEQRSREMLRIHNENNMFGRKLYDWEIDRALSLSRGLGMVFLRFPEIVAEIPTPTPTGTIQSKRSLVWEKLAWELNPMDHRIKRYESQFGLRAIFYAAKERGKGRKLWNQDELKDFVALDAIATMAGNERIIDFMNIFRTGGPFTWVPWRPFMAALNEDVDVDEDTAQTVEKYRAFLGVDPGIAAKMFFNRYKYYNLTFDKLDFRRRAKGQFDNDQERLSAWEQEEKAIRAGYKEEGAWKKANEEMWKGAANRIPHVVLRLALEEHNRLLSEKQRLDLMDSLKRELGMDYYSKDFSQIERDLVTAKENMMRRRREAGAAFTNEENQLTDEDFRVIGDERRIELAKKLRDIVVSRLNSDEDLMKALTHRDGVGQEINTNWTFCPTLEDTALGEYRYEQTGARGFFARKITDAFLVSEGDDELITLLKQIPNFRSAEEIVEQLKKIYYKIEPYNKEAAQDSLGTIATGIIRFFEKDGILKVPIYGEMMQILNSTRSGDNARGNSYAQTIYGGRAMAWDSDDIYNFTEMLKTMLVDKNGAKIIKRVREETGGTAWQGFYRRSKVAIYLLILFGFYELASKLMTEKQ